MRVLMRRRMNSLTMPLISFWASPILLLSLSDAVGSLPLRIGNMYSLRKPSCVPSTPGLMKSTIAKNSCRSFWIGRS